MPQGSIHNGDKPLVGILMGSKSDQPTMNATAEMLNSLGIAWEMTAMSAHRTPEEVAEYAMSAERRGLEILIAAAGGAAHLAGVVASMTVLPVLGVPMMGWSMNGLDSLLSTVQMPGGVPVATFAIGKPGATNAAVFAAEILGAKYPEIREKVKAMRAKNREKILAEKLDPLP
ncbi:MAG TPA: 5-(carboxyamino)imidazole ribonucleotide mutase [Phycisphaerae bacterium]|jgi:5-(carboxyamino)imidazole ribonucleotide mutase|nr:5-(carboxyamino)imidazole ribonucleotide mutase [Phycisphaerae bacterium]